MVNDDARTAWPPSPAVLEEASAPSPPLKAKILEGAPKCACFAVELAAGSARLSAAFAMKVLIHWQ